MSPYGWVGTWNWTLAALGNSDGLAYKDYYRGLTKYDTYASAVFRLRAEKVLSPSYASALVLDYGFFSVDQLYEGLLGYRASSTYGVSNFALAWEQKANSSGTWVPTEGWTWGWGPRGKAFRPSMDVKIALLSDRIAWGSKDSWVTNPHMAFALTLPLFNGCALLIDHSGPMSQFSSLRPTESDDLIRTRAAFDSSSYFEATSIGLELAMPQFGYPNALVDANPDGRLYHPRLTFNSSAYNLVAISRRSMLIVPLSPRTTLSVGTEWMESFQLRAQELQRYTLAWQIYAGNPEHPAPNAAAKARKELPAGPYRRPTERH